MIEHKIKMSFVDEDSNTIEDIDVSLVKSDETITASTDICDTAQASNNFDIVILGEEKIILRGDRREFIEILKFMENMAYR